MYETRLAGLECWVAYIFTEGRLTRAKYIIQEKHMEGTKHIRDYDELKKNLIKKYGDPMNDNVFWNNDLYKDDYSSWGTAISIGHLSYFAKWDSPDTEIALALYGDNFEVTLGIEYVSKKLREFDKKAGEKRTLEDF